MRRFSVYKGLQKPLVFKGFKGKFIYWGVGFIVASLIMGGLLGSLINLVAGIGSLIIVMFGGLAWCAAKQKNGLNDKAINIGLYCIPVKFKDHDQTKKIRIQAAVLRGKQIT